MQPTEQPLPTRHRTVLDEDDRHVARVYAEALYGAAEKQGRVDEVLGELDGLVGEVFRREPVLELLLASPSIGRDRKEHRRLGLAGSSDGVIWEKLPGAFAGSERWDNKVICDPSVLIEGDSIRVWFGGGDAASPDENLHGQIGTARLIPIP